MSDFNLHELFETNTITGCESHVIHVDQTDQVYDSADYDITNCDDNPVVSSHKQIFISTLPKSICFPVIWFLIVEVWLASSTRLPVFCLRIMFTLQQLLNHGSTMA